MTGADYDSSNRGEKPSPCSLLSYAMFTYAGVEAMFEVASFDPRSYNMADTEASMFTSYRRVLPETYLDEFVHKFEALLARFGIEACIFLKERPKRLNGCDKMIGRVCMIRSHCKRPEEVEFGVRSVCNFSFEMMTASYSHLSIINYIISTLLPQDCWRVEKTAF